MPRRKNQRWPSHFVRMRRPKWLRGYIYNSLRRLGITLAMSRRMRDWTLSHILLYVHSNGCKKPEDIGDYEFVEEIRDMLKEK